MPKDSISGDDQWPRGAGFGEIVRARREALGLTLAELSQRVECAKSYLSAIENGVKGAPSDDLAIKLEGALGFTDDELVDAARLARTPESVREDLEALRERDARARELAKTLREHGASIDTLHRTGELERLIRALEGEAFEDKREDLNGAPALRIPREIPLINKVTAGYPGSFTDLGYPARVADEYVRSPDIDDPDAFAARVVGDSMSPEYREGDIVVFSPARAVVSGMDCFIRLEPDHENTFKRVYFERGARGEELIRIQPINNAYAPMVVAREEVAGLYAGVSVTRVIGGN
jgi:transcriptional regulator with XRE-family HTH domain